jgi:hypothetical protein
MVCAALASHAASGRAQRAAPAQSAMPLRPSIRADVIIDRDPGAQLATGLSVVAAYNTRLSIDAGVGAMQRDNRWRASGRVDLMARVLADPFRQSRWGAYAAGGIGLRTEARRAPDLVGILALGFEGPGDGRWLRGVEVGLGGGVRAGVTLRRAPLRRR